MGGLCWRMLAVWIGLLPWAAVAQPADTLLSSDARPLASFSDARSVAVDRNGMLYVADAGKDVVRILSADGSLAYTLGGPGSREGQFDEPVDVDPTNGLVLIVADYGNGRLQRFSSEHLYLGSIPLGGSSGPPSRTASSTAFRDGAGPSANAPGRPASVVSNPTNDIYAIDAARGVVLKWDSGRRLERVIGGYDAGAGTLEEPVSLALDDTGKLYVADRKQGEVLVYDRFGSYARALGNGRLDGLRAVSVGQRVLWVVAGSRLFKYDLNGLLLDTFQLGTSEPVVDVAGEGGALYLLTPRNLYQVVP